VYEGGRTDGQWPVTSTWRGEGSFDLVQP
jgi:hypothetical protein